MEEFLISGGFFHHHIDLMLYNTSFLMYVDTWQVVNYDMNLKLQNTSNDFIKKIGVSLTFSEFDIHDDIKAKHLLMNGLRGLQHIL